MHRPTAQDLVEWFLAHFAGAADLLPDRNGSADAPFDPRAELAAQFPNATAYDLDAAVAEIQQQGYDWSSFDETPNDEAGLADLTTDDVRRIR